MVVETKSGIYREVLVFKANAISHEYQSRVGCSNGGALGCRSSVFGHGEFDPHPTHYAENENILILGSTISTTDYFRCGDIA